MNKIILITVIVAAIALPASLASAMPFASIAHDDGVIAIKKKRGGTSRSAISGRFITRSHAKQHPSTTITHGKY